MRRKTRERNRAEKRRMMMMMMRNSKEWKKSWQTKQRDENDTIWGKAKTIQHPKTTKTKMLKRTNQAIR